MPKLYSCNMLKNMFKIMIEIAPLAKQAYSEIAWYDWLTVTQRIRIASCYLQNGAYVGLEIEGFAFCLFQS